MTWNTPKPGEWKSEELSQGRIIDYKAFNFKQYMLLNEPADILETHKRVRWLMDATRKLLRVSNT